LWPWQALGTSPVSAPRQRIFVQNTGKAALAGGRIDLEISFTSRAGREEPVAKMPTHIAAGQAVQVAIAHHASQCQATFTRQTLIDFKKL
jgi:hypothetical protein